MLRAQLQLIASLSLAVLTSPALSRGSDLPVGYTVEERPLKAADSGTDLMFELFSDAACTVLVHTDVIAIDNVTLLSRLALLKPRHGTQPPKTVELRLTLSGVTPATTFYLRVTGVGIVPVGRVCQAQVSTVDGPPGPEGQPGLPGPPGPPGAPRILDAIGNEIGILVSYSPVSSNPHVNQYEVFVPQHQRLLSFRVEDSANIKRVVPLYNRTNLAFAGPNCSGQAYVATEEGPLDEIHLHFFPFDYQDPINGRFFVAGAPLPDGTSPAASYLGPITGGACANQASGSFHLFTYLATEVAMPFPVPIAGPLGMGQ